MISEDSVQQERKRNTIQQMVPYGYKSRVRITVVRLVSVEINTCTTIDSDSNTLFLHK